MHPVVTTQACLVQALPSSQAASLGVWKQPPAASHPSSVQVTPSLQSTAAPPWQRPARQVAGVAHGSSPTPQAVPLVAVTSVQTPVDGWHCASTQGVFWPGSQTTALPATATQTPPTQANWPSQRSGSAATQAAASRQAQVLVPDTQPPLAQLSPWVQGLPSSQAPTESGACVQPVVALQLSPVQGSPSSQLIVPLPLHAPSAQALALVQTLLSSQAK